MKPLTIFSALASVAVFGACGLDGELEMNGAEVSMTEEELRGGRGKGGGGSYASSCLEGDSRLCGMVDAHNAVRARDGQWLHDGDPVMYPVAVLPPIGWSTVLAAKAQEWANKCTVQHSSGYAGAGFSSTSENIAVASFFLSSGGVTGAWASERSYIDFNTGCQPGKVCGHYTNIINPHLVEIGCGVKECGRISGGTTIAKGYVWVCAYGRQY
jgi:pathogenesis-related protein 1